MNAAIEYLLRNKRARQLLTTPCSFMLEKDTRKRVVSIHSCYGDNESVNIKHWNLWEDIKTNKLPPFIDTVVPRKDIFSSDMVIIKGYDLLYYTEEPYETGNKQYAEPPYSFTQEHEYTFCLDKFYNNPAHIIKRTDWLWTEFEKIHVPEKLKWHYGHNTPQGKLLQREIVEFYNRSVWNKWLGWRKHLLDFPCTVATELIMRPEYYKEPTKIIEPAIPSGGWYNALVSTSTTSTTSTNLYVEYI